MMFLKNKSGVTLIEVLVAISLFSIAAVISTSILVDVVQLEKKSSVQNAVYEDLRMILSQLTKEIQNGTIDYEEYYSYYVVQKDDPTRYYGLNYGVYGSKFYDPGKSLDGENTASPADLGIECSRPDNFDPENDECEIVYTLSADLNTGQNPFFTGINQADAPVNNAFCEGGGCAAKKAWVTDKLFLIDKTGTQKTIITSQEIEGVADKAIGLMRMKGMDLDQNGIVDLFYCSEDFACGTRINEGLIKFYDHLPAGAREEFDNSVANKLSVPSNATSTHPFDKTHPEETEFVPISPLRSNIIDLKFIVSPVEDPYKAYAEKAMKSQPVVTIMVTIGLSSEAEKDYPGTFVPVTFQTTVSAGVIGRIDSYPPINDIKTEGTPSWMAP